MQPVLVAVIVVCFLLLLLLVAYARNDVSALNGVWIGDASFCEAAQLATWMLTIPDARQQYGYLIMIGDDGEEIYNTTVKMKIAPKLRLWGPRTFQVDDFADGESPLPRSFLFRVDQSRQSLTVADRERLYAFAYKDMAASAAISLEPQD